MSYKECHQKIEDYIGTLKISRQNTIYYNYVMKIQQGKVLQQT